MGDRSSAALPTSSHLSTEHKPHWLLVWGQEWCSENGGIPSSREGESLSLSALSRAGVTPSEPEISHLRSQLHSENAGTAREKTGQNGAKRAGLPTGGLRAVPDSVKVAEPGSKLENPALSPRSQHSPSPPGLLSPLGRRWVALAQSCSISVRLLRLWLLLFFSSRGWRQVAVAQEGFWFSQSYPASSAGNRRQWPATVCPVSRPIAAFGRRQDHEDGAVVRRKELLACSWIKVKEGERQTDSSQLLLLKCFISCSV